MPAGISRRSLSATTVRSQLVMAVKDCHRLGRLRCAPRHPCQPGFSEARVQVRAGLAHVEVRAKPVTGLEYHDRALIQVPGLLPAGHAPDVVRQHLSWLAAEPQSRLSGRVPIQMAKPSGSCSQNSSSVTRPGTRDHRLAHRPDGRQ